MGERPLIDWIIEAFRNLGGRAHLRNIYAEVRRLGYDRGGKDPDKIIRSEIQKHSRDSLRFTRNPNHDRFQHVGGERSGIWELRQHRADGPEMLSEEEADRADSIYVSQEGDRRRVLERQIRERRGQQQFRDAVREKYGDRCLITGCEVLAVLEAAHTRPYRGDNDNHPANGLLLRADVHTLFDLDLLGIEPEGLRVELHPVLVEEYGCLANLPLRCSGKLRPDHEALSSRYDQFQQRLRRSQ